MTGFAKLDVFLSTFVSYIREMSMYVCVSFNKSKQLHDPSVSHWLYISINFALFQHCICTQLQISATVVDLNLIKLCALP